MRRRCMLLYGLGAWLAAGLGRLGGREQAGSACSCPEPPAGQSGAVYHPGHRCPRCGRTQLVVYRQGPGRYHTHRHGQTLWYH
jgi:hypothetical protein